MAKSILFGASKPTAFDGSMILPDGDCIFPGTIASFQFDDLAAPPANGQVIRNRAWRQFAALTGRDASDEAECHGTFVIGSDAAADRLKLAITPKGGLYGSPSLTLGGSNTHAYINAGDAVKQYILDHTLLAGASATDTAQPWNVPENHAILHLVWVAMGRAGRTDSGKTGQNVTFCKISNMIGMTEAATSPSYPILGVENSGKSTTISSLVGNLSYPALPMAVGVPQMRYAATRGWFSSKPASVAAFDCICGFGPLPGQSAGGFQQSAPSLAIYRWDIIDGALACPYGDAKAFRGIGGTDYRHTISDLFEPRNQLMAAKARAFSPGGQFYGDVLPSALA